MAKTVPATRARAGRPGKQQRASGGTLEKERICRAALALIDQRGLAAFNIRELALALGVAPAAIYWHVPGRDALLGAVVSLALGGIADNLPALPWQQRLSALLRRFRDALRAHPHLAPAVASELAYNAHFDAPLLDEIVAVLEAARFDGPALVDAFNVVVAAMCGFATLELSSVPAEAAPEWEAACRARIEAQDPQATPHLVRRRDALRNRAFMLRWTSGIEQPLDSGFDAWIDVVVRGLESRSRALRRAVAKQVPSG